MPEQVAHLAKLGEDGGLPPPARTRRAFRHPHALARSCGEDGAVSGLFPSGSREDLILALSRSGLPWSICRVVADLLGLDERGEHRPAALDALGGLGPQRACGGRSSRRAGLLRREVAELARPLGKIGGDAGSLLRRRRRNGRTRLEPFAAVGVVVSRSTGTLKRLRKVWALAEVPGG